jgi:hypothetical protein
MSKLSCSSVLVSQRPGLQLAKPAQLRTLRRLLLLLISMTLAPTATDGAAVGFPLGGDGGEELWQAVQDAADNKGMDAMLALLEAGANVNWQNEEMVRHLPVRPC